MYALTGLQRVVAVVLIMIFMLIGIDSYNVVSMQMRFLHNNKQKVTGAEKSAFSNEIISPMSSCVSS